MPQTELARALRSALDTATDLGAKRDVAVSVISPRVLGVAGDQNAQSQLLAGEFLAHFGGFIEERFRENDFSVGYRSAVRWLHGALELHGLSADLAASALAGAEQAERDWADRNGRRWVEGGGETTVAGLSWREKLRLLRLLGRSVRIAISQLR